MTQSTTSESTGCPFLTVLRQGEYDQAAHTYFFNYFTELYQKFLHEKISGEKFAKKSAKLFKTAFCPETLKSSGEEELQKWFKVIDRTYLEEKKEEKVESAPQINIGEMMGSAMGELKKFLPAPQTAPQVNANNQAAQPPPFLADAARYIQQQMQASAPQVNTNQPAPPSGLAGLPQIPLAAQAPPAPLPGLPGISPQPQAAPQGNFNPNGCAHQ